MKRILLVGSQHGNELLGDYLYKYIVNNYPELLPSIEYIIANPEAYRKGVRFIESDLNRSYKKRQITYEEHRASDIKQFIDKKDFDLILDLHTTRCIQPPSFITCTINGEVGKFIAASSIHKVAIMPQLIAEHSLIGIENCAVSIEVQDDTINNDLLDKLTQDICRYVKNKALSKSIEYYDITAPLFKSDISKEDVAKLINFQYSKHGFYPILVGENSYKKDTNYLGFKALLNNKSNESRV